MTTPSCNCKFEHVCAALTTTITTGTVHHHHHYHHYVEREEGHERASSRAAKVFVNKLTPPIGTSFFQKETINIFNNEKLGLKPSHTFENVTWHTEVYKYVTRVNPDDPDFKRKGGEIYIIMVHGGTSRKTKQLLPMYAKTVKAPSGITPMKQYPSSNSGIQTGDNWSYNIDYTSTMPMFNNGGNGAFDFEASYKEDFVLSRLKQTGAVVANGVEFATIDPQDLNLDTEILGLSVFKCLDPTVFPAKFTFQALAGSRGDLGTVSVGTASKEIIIDFDFSISGSDQHLHTTATRAFLKLSISEQASGGLGQFSLNQGVKLPALFGSEIALGGVHVEHPFQCKKISQNWFLLLIYRRHASQLYITITKYHHLARLWT
ncbi:hypothetical protein AB1N83_008395 [Pleurotus pulmonarius]